MKKILVIAVAIALCAINSYAQGYFNFLNSLSTLVTVSNSTTHTTSLGAATNGTTVELLYQPGGGSVPAAELLGPPGVQSLNPSAAWETIIGANPFALTDNLGRFNAGTFESTGTDVASGANAWLTVVGWTGGFADLQDAISGGAAVGESTIFELPSGVTNPPGTTEITAAAVAGQTFGGVVLVTPSPEPAIIAIGGFGTAALLLFRRRRK